MTKEYFYVEPEQVGTQSTLSTLSSNVVPNIIELTDHDINDLANKYNEKQYRYIGLTLNRRGKKVTRTTNVDAATRYVQDHLATDGATYNTKYNK